MYCWSCGTPLDDAERVCSRCGTARAGLTEPVSTRSAIEAPRPHPPAQLRSCPACGFRGEGIPYFRRAGNLALLTVASLFTYLVGGLVYWLIKRNDQVCPSCGLSWERSRPLGGGPPAPIGQGNGERSGGAAASPNRREASPTAPLSDPVSEKGLPRSGMIRRFSGVFVGLFAIFFLGVAVIEADAVPVLIGGLMGLTGAATFGWGWKAQHRRREALMQRMQRRVLLLARNRGGRLTATEVAAELDLTLPASERLLLSLDDGFRVRSDVSDEGILYFEFPEILLTRGSDAAGPLGAGRSALPRG